MVAAKVNRGANLRGGCGRLRSFLGTRPDLAGVPDGLYRGKEIFLVPGQTSPAAAAAPRPRKRSATCFEPSEASETFSGVFWSFPRPRKRSAACFDAFRRVGNVQRRVLTFSEASDGGQTCAAGRSPPIPPIFAAGYLVYGCVASYPIPCLTTTYYSEITLTTTYNGITVWNRRASQRGEVDLV